MDLHQNSQVIFNKDQKNPKNKKKPKKPNWKIIVFSASNSGITVHLYVNKQKTNKQTPPKKEKPRQRLHPLTEN